jgi:sec-independent protein translocase protein TatA
MTTNLFNTIFLFNMPGGGEWIFIILAIVLLFGGKKIPELMRGVGKGMREFKDAKDNVKSEIEEGMKQKDMQSSTTAEEIRLQELKLKQLREQQTASQGS